MELEIFINSLEQLRDLPKEQQQQSEPVIRNNQLLSKTKKLRRKKRLRSQRNIKNVDQEVGVPFSINI